MSGYILMFAAMLCGYMFSRIFWVGWETARRVVARQAYLKHFHDLYGIQPVDPPVIPSFSRVLYGINKYPPTHFREFDMQIQEFYHDHQADFMKMFMENGGQS